MNLKHSQFSPERNRLYGGAPLGMAEIELRVEQHAVDPENPYHPIHTGIYTDKVADNKGKEREYLFCVPSTVQPSGNTVVVFGSAGQTPQELFEDGNWAEKLEKYQAAGCFVVPDGDWDRENPGDELDWFDRVYARMRDIQYYASNADSQYAIGLGTGAFMVSLFSLLQSSVFAAFAAAGSFTGIDEAVLEAVGKLPSDGDSNVLKRNNPISGWILDEDGSGKPVAEYLKTAVGVKEEQLRNDIARIWRQDPKPGTLYLNEQPVSEVWYSEKDNWASVSSDALADRLLAFVTGYKRWGGSKNWYIRRSKKPADMGLVKKELTVDGLKRHWYVYEPSAYKADPKKEYPLVVAIHGFSCSGAFYAENSNWDAVAEERGLIVAFPTAYPHLRGKNAPHFRNAAPCPAWNSDPDMTPEGPDDVHFLCEMVAAMKNAYPIDATRVYVTGHSNGSAMTQLLMRQVPELFAAFGGIGAMEANFKNPAPMPNDTIRPVWYIMGEYDLGDGDKLEEGNKNVLTIRNLCRNNKTDYDGASYYVSGIYKNLVAYNKYRVPLVRFTGVTGWPHTVSPETSLMLYDEFFSKFIRLADGTSVYIG